MMTPVLALGDGAALLAAKSSLLIGLAWAATQLLRRAPAAARHAVWLTAIVGVLLIPAVDRWVPIPVPVLPGVAAQQLVAVPPGIAGIDHGASALPGGQAAAANAQSLHARSSHSGPSVAQICFIVWLTIAAVLLGRLGLGFVTITRLMRRGRSPSSPDWTTTLAATARTLEVRVLPRLVVSDEVDTAFAFDLVSPTIVLPASAAEWPDDRRQSVLLHELAHIRRRDLVGYGVSGVACALNWFNPFVWLAARRLRVESELASDEIVLGTGVRPSTYAQHLLDLVTTMKHRAPAAALAMARPQELEGRLIAILDPLRRSAVVRRQGTFVAAVLALCAISIGAVAPAPRRLRVAAVNSPRSLATPAERDPASSVSALPRTQSSASPAVAVERRSARRLSTAAVASLLRYGTSGIMNPMIMLLREGDSLQLTAKQADSIATLNRHYMVRLSEIWSPIAAYYAWHADGADDADGARDARDASAYAHPAPNGAMAMRATADALAALLPSLGGLLSAEQRRRVSATTAAYLDPTMVAASVGRPDGVFVPADQLYGLRGRGRGGG
jgi:beta-lactamase regulating signal transducer with metallopeptidase domain